MPPSSSEVIVRIGTEFVLVAVTDDLLSIGRSASFDGVVLEFASGDGRVRRFEIVVVEIASATRLAGEDHMGRRVEVLPLGPQEWSRFATQVGVTIGFDQALVDLRDEFDHPYGRSPRPVPE